MRRWQTLLLGSLGIGILGGFLVTELGISPVASSDSAQVDLRAVFEQKYQAWLDYIKQPEIAFSSSIEPYIENQPFRDIVALGVPALPFIMETVERERGLTYACMSHAASRILKRKNWKEGWVRVWWNTGRLEIPKEFDAHLNTWQEAQARGDLRKAASALVDLEGIGVLALPLFVEKVAAGKSELIPAISGLTDGAVKADATPEQVTAWWADNKAKWTLPQEKQPQPAPAEMQVLSVELQPGEATRIPLTHDHVVLLQPDGKLVEIPVVLEKIRCQYTVRRLFRGKPCDLESSTFVYELRSADPGIKYSWAFTCEPIMPGSVRGFQLSSSGKGENYLAWVDGLDVCIAEVSEPRDMKTAVAQRFDPTGAPSIVRARLTDLLPGRDLGYNDFYVEVAVQSVGKKQTGDWVISVISEVTGRDYTIVGDGKNWHRE